jgi:hypothetical protein
LRAAEAAGRDPAAITPAVIVTINVGDRASSERALERYVGEYYGYPLDVVSSIQACRAGSGDQILSYLLGFWEAGARAFVLRMASPDGPEHQLDAVADAVLPVLSSWREQTVAAAVQARASRSAAEANSRVESSVGRGDSSERISSGISVQARATASQPRSRRRAITAS